MYRNFQLLLRVTMILIFLGTTASQNETPPRMIERHLTRVILFEFGKPFILECEAQGQPVPWYQWTKDDKNFTSSLDETKNDVIFIQNYGTLNFTNPKHEDAGRYQCFSHNEFGTATSSPVMVLEKDSFENYPTSLPTLYVNEGEPLNVTCNPIQTGRTISTIFDWRKEDSNKSMNSVNDRRITVGPDKTLWFSYVTLDDNNFVYHFSQQIDGKQEVMCSTPLAVKPMESKNSLPKIQYVTPKNKKVLSGVEETKLFCIYSGNPLPETIWLKNGSIIPMNSTDKHIVIEDFNKSLTIQSVTIEDAGNYTCNVKNIEGSESHTIELEVLDMPYFVDTPEIEEKHKGDTAVIKCSASGSPEPTIEWIHNGRPLSKASPNPRRNVSMNSITITSLTESDIGNYGCNASNIVGYVYKDVYVNVLESPLKFTEYVTRNGTSITIGCKLFGSSVPKINWTKNSVELSGERYSLLENGGLQISKVSFNDSGNYTCHFTGGENEGAESITKRLIVREPTVVEIEPKVSKNFEESNSTFHCRVKGYNQSSHNINWFINDTLISFDNTTKFIKVNDSSITVINNTELDTGTYTCEVETDFDKVNDTANLIIQRRPLQEPCITVWLIYGIIIFTILVAVLGIILCKLNGMKNKK